MVCRRCAERCSTPTNLSLFPSMFISPSQSLLSRRSFLSHTGTGLSAIALAQLLTDDRLLAKDSKTPLRPAIDPRQPHAPRKAHFAAKAKNVLVIFCSGACSQVDTWDYKPELMKRDGQPMPGSEKLVTFQGEQ